MNAVTKREQWVDWLSGIFEDPEKVNERFDWLQMHCHLISTTTICPPIPQGFGVTFNIVRIDTKTMTYPVGGVRGGGEDDGGGKRGLGKVALWKLANAAEISWDGDRSYRVDDGKEPYYCHWHAVGARRDLNGCWKLFDGDCRFDVRDGGAAWQKIMQSVRTKRKRGNEYVDLTPEEIEEAGRIQVRDFRAKLLERTQTGAKERAIRDTLEIRTYDAEELKKPWVIATLVFTGRHSDPSIERADHEKVVDRFLAGSSAFFGAPVPRARALPPRPIAYRLPPIGEASDVPDTAPPSDPGPIDVEGELPCDYCGSFEDVRMVSTRTGEIPVCSNRECDDRARGEISPQAHAAAGGPPPPQGTGSPRTRSSAPPPPMGASSHQDKAPSSPPPHGPRDGFPPPPRGSTQEPYHGTGKQPRSGEQIKIRGGVTVDIEDANDSDLTFWRQRLAANLSQGRTPDRFRAKDEKTLSAIINEQASRKAPY